jgi:DNA-binding beta-propeller fold protein YncE
MLAYRILLEEAFCENARYQCSAASGRVRRKLIHTKPSDITADEAGYTSRIFDNGGTCGEGAGVAITPDGLVLFLHRAGAGYGNTTRIDRPVVVVYDPRSDRVIKEWGAGMFVSPHGIACDRDGNVWITDTATNRVAKFSPDGELLLSIGHDYPPGLELLLRARNVLAWLPMPDDPYIFARPTEVAVDSDGRIIITDGYRNSRLAVFDYTGRFIQEIKARGNGDYAFNLPHGVAVDSADRIYVADRTNARVQIFYRDCRHLATWQGPAIGRPFGIDIAGGRGHC